jgi:hypothetical protein
MRPCTCGREVRLGAYRITVNRKRGVAHYIAHIGDGTKPCVGGDWGCAMLKPYPKNEDDKPWRQLLVRWDETVSRAAQAVTS